MGRSAMTEVPKLLFQVFQKCIVPEISVIALRSIPAFVEDENKVQ